MSNQQSLVLQVLEWVEQQPRLKSSVSSAPDSVAASFDSLCEYSKGPNMTPQLPLLVWT